jgi:transcription elongation factor GreA
MTVSTAVPSHHEVPMTREGYERLRDELATLTTTARAEITDRLRAAREDGELADNLELIDALEDQDLLEHRIAALEAAMASARVVHEPPRDGTIGIGTSIELRDIDRGRDSEYELVGSVEADPAQRRLSVASPVGRALFGRRTGDVLEVQVPRGMMRIRILAVDPNREARRSARPRSAELQAA